MKRDNSKPNPAANSISSQNWAEAKRYPSPTIKIPPNSQTDKMSQTTLAVAKTDRSLSRGGEDKLAPTCPMNCKKKFSHKLEICHEYDARIMHFSDWQARFKSQNPNHPLVLKNKLSELYDQTKKASSTHFAKQMKIEGHKETESATQNMSKSERSQNIVLCTMTNDDLWDMVEEQADREDLSEELGSITASALCAVIDKPPIHTVTTKVENQLLQNNDTFERTVESRIRRNFEDRADSPTKLDFAFDKAKRKAWPENKKHFSYETHYRVLSLDGGSFAITPALQDGTNSKSIFSIHASYLKKFELGTLKKMLSNGVEEPQNFEGVLDNRFVSRERL